MPGGIDGKLNQTVQVSFHVGNTVPTLGYRLDTTATRYYWPHVWISKLYIKSIRGVDNYYNICSELQ